MKWFTLRRNLNRATSNFGVAALKKCAPLFLSEAHLLNQRRWIDQPPGNT
jgi:hypothetical protein